MIKVPLFSVHYTRNDYISKYVRKRKLYNVSIKIQNELSKANIVCRKICSRFYIPVTRGATVNTIYRQVEPHRDSSLFHDLCAG